MSWSENRRKEISRSSNEILEKIDIVNAVLRQLAIDSDLTDDLNDSIVQIAIKHWTNEKRLSINEAKKLEDNYRVIAVLKKLHQLQHSCKALGIAVPLDHFLSRKNSLSEQLISNVFGDEIVKLMKEKDIKKLNNLSLSTLSSSETLKEKSNSKSTSTKPSPVEYGPQLPSQSPQEQNKIDYSWGKEPYGSPGFTWFKCITRSTIEIILVSIVAILISFYLNSNKLNNKTE